MSGKRTRKSRWTSTAVQVYPQGSSWSVGREIDAQLGASLSETVDDGRICSRSRNPGLCPPGEGEEDVSPLAPTWLSEREHANATQNP